MKNIRRQCVGSSASKESVLNNRGDRKRKNGKSGARRRSVNADNMNNVFERSQRELGPVAVVAIREGPIGAVIRVCGPILGVAALALRRDDETKSWKVSSSLYSYAPRL